MCLEPEWNYLINQPTKQQANQPTNHIVEVIFSQFTLRRADGSCTSVYA
jgi:hypothetical protein